MVVAGPDTEEFKMWEFILKFRLPLGGGDPTIWLDALYTAGEIKAVKAFFPDPVYTGNPSLWRLAEVLCWLDHNTELHPIPRIRDVARVASEINLEIQRQRLGRLTAAE